MKIRQISKKIAVLHVSTAENPYLNVDSLGALKSAVEQLNAQSDLCAVILVGHTDYFSAGGSLKALKGFGSANPLSAFDADFPRLMLSIKVPTIAAMAGHAIGGGLILGLWCDLVYLAEESLYGANFMTLGFTPGMGGTQILFDAFGLYLGNELLYSGKLLKGRAIKEQMCPLSYAVLPKDEVVAHAMSIAEEISEIRRPALMELKQKLVARRMPALDVVLKQEKEMHDLLMNNEQIQDCIALAYRHPLDT